ncbi:hypothetical protein [Butyrivibrio sp. XPD2002]|uniref:hypothetical protein n=1 Tax=Butyrivibrio sp. XPD2002 TaxID=1280665 RepID=UPI000415CA01|nr:hypothetical protein [Butyrivibrio sp. XPD2002]
MVKEIEGTTTHFTIDDIKPGEEIDLGIVKDIREQLKEGRKAVAVFSDKEYLFTAFSDGDHIELFDYQKDRVEGTHYYISSYYEPNQSDMGICIYPVGGYHIISDFERRVMYRLLKEVKDSECIIPEGIDSCASGLESQIRDFERESERLLREKEKQELAEKAATEEKRRRDNTFKGKILNMLGR